MQKTKLIAVLCVLAVLLSVFSGCGDSQGKVPENAKKVQVLNKIAAAEVGEKYNLSKIIIEQKNVEYSASASYVDPASGKTVALDVTELSFVPEAAADILVKIFGKSDTDTYYTEVTVPMGEIKQVEENTLSDIMDSLLATDGAAGQAAEGVVKTVISDNQYIKGENSTSSLMVKFQNPTKSSEGAQLLTLSHYSLMAYYSARVWDNAAVTFWVYNPMEQDVQLKLTSYNEYNERTLLWDSEQNTQVQLAKAGEWTYVSFSLYKMGIDNVLFTDDSGIHKSRLTVDARCEGTEECTVYIDGLDVVLADTVEGLETGYEPPPLPEGDFSDLFATCQVVTSNEEASLSISDKGNGSEDSVCFGASEPLGSPSFRVNFPQETDISGFDYLKFDMYAEKCYPWASVSVIYIDENGEEQRSGKGFDTYREQWRTLYMNLDYVKDADLTRVVGFGFSINVSTNMVEDAFNCVYFDNLSLFTYPNAQPELPAPLVEDYDLISGPMCPANTIPGINGVCKVAEDEEGTQKSNSQLLFWTNTASGYPNVTTTFMFDEEQDWSKSQIFSFDSHMYGAHYLLMFTLITLDENDNIQYLKMRTDTVLTHWMTNSMPMNWFTAEDGSEADFSRVIGMTIGVDLAVNVTREIGHIFLDNVYVY